MSRAGIAQHRALVLLPSIPPSVVLALVALLGATARECA